MRYVLCFVAVSLGFASVNAQEPAAEGNPFGPVEDAVDDATTKGQTIPGSVTFAFDGGTLRCTFGVSDRNATPHVAMIVFPSAADAMVKRTGISIERERDRAIVLSSADGKFVQLTSKSVSAWSRVRIAEMSGRRSSVAENSFVSAAVHALSNDLAVSVWGSDAQDALESGHWCKLFDKQVAAASEDSFGDPFGGDPFK
ncbi:hypothetical protein Enr13x_59870 [Stieleria neptunia]|uniref:Uncharacterized protein n=1 Tax=Stieleria neptunia TaxID=2527979 RepID=A0A518HZ03_9BACT|nr:hypothetical protein [Stieleria neptunia]QDV46083.1 hypothetical protein Enr13x_59870 [Stieleria neptunia]